MSLSHVVDTPRQSLESSQQTTEYSYVPSQKARTSGIHERLVLEIKQSLLDLCIIVLEFLPKKDLEVYLCSQRPEPGVLPESSLPSQLLKFCRQIADGMKYLSSKSFIHRDLATTEERALGQEPQMQGIATTCTYAAGALLSQLHAHIRSPEWFQWISPDGAKGRS